jgi:NTE family protein
MVDRALVMGGGGIVGIAWETGILKGLLGGGVDPSAADLVIGTSAGATVGAQVAAGANFGDLLAAQLGPIDPRQTQLLAEGDHEAAAAVFAYIAAAGELTQPVRAQIGAMALAAKAPSEARRLEMVDARLGIADWPPTRLLITSVDAVSGAFVVWEKGAGATLAQAVAASSAVPGLYPPVTIADRRYIDGGFRSGTSADLAHGAKSVLIVAPIGRGNKGTAALTRQLDGEIAEVEAAGGKVLLIEPDAASLEAFGPNLMDPDRRAVAADAGVRQGQAIAAEARKLWTAVPA